MHATALHVLLAATVFLEQEIPGLRYFISDSLTGAVQANYRQIDIDNDGRIDLLFVDRVVFQRDGLYPSGSSAELPDFVSGSLCDTAAQALYLRQPGKLSELTWTDDGWHVRSEQQIDWPDLRSELPDDTTEVQPATALPMRFSRFLVDIESDGTPEIVVYASEGVHVYRKSQGEYERIDAFDLYPRMATTAAESGNVWPPERRRLLAPGQRLDLTALWRDAELTIVSRRDLYDGTVQYRSRTLSFATLPEHQAPAIEEITYPVMDSVLRPIFLNNDASLDFAGGAHASLSSRPFAEPLFDTFVSTDGGRSVKRLRTKSFIPRNNFVDIDGDGDIDIVQHKSGITSEGLRESLNRYFFQRGVRHTVSFHIQDKEGNFSLAQGLTVEHTIQMERVPYREGSVFRRYRAGDLIDATGDFNGDGLKDLVIQENSESIAVFISRGYRFSKHPIYYVSVNPSERFYITDVDSNGMSDIALIQPGTDRSGDRSRVYFARRTRP